MPEKKQLNKEQLEKVYGAKDKKGILDIDFKKSIELSAGDLEMVNGGNLELVVDTTALKSLKDILEDSI